MDRSAYASKLDQERPYELISDLESALAQSRLAYRYLDSGETVEVPNLWYNQTLELRARTFDRQAADIAVLADNMARRESHLLSEAEMARKEVFYRDLARAYRLQAAQFREEALQKLEALKQRAILAVRAAAAAASDSQPSIPAWQIPAATTSPRIAA